MNRENLRHGPDHCLHEMGRWLLSAIGKASKHTARARKRIARQHRPEAACRELADTCIRCAGAGEEKRRCVVWCAGCGEGKTAGTVNA